MDFTIILYINSKFITMTKTTFIKINFGIFMHVKAKSFFCMTILYAYYLVFFKFNKA